MNSVYVKVWRLLCCMSACLLSMQSIGYAQELQRFEFNSTTADEYTPALRYNASGNIEVWFTAMSNLLSRDSAKNSRSRSIFVAEYSREQGELLGVRSAPEAVNSLGGNAGSVVLHGSPTFASCDFSRGAFVSNRMVDGKSYGNDIYFIDALTMSTVRGNDVVNSAYWDDTPSLSEDGELVFLASDRMQPGTRDADVFVYNRTTNQIAKLDLFARGVSEETPFCVGNTLYFSANPDGQYDIYAVELSADRMESLSPPAPIELSGVNQPTSDETHPYFSPSGSWFTYSSNGHSDERRDFDVLYTRVDKAKQTLEISVFTRRREYNENVSIGAFNDVVEPTATTIICTDLDTREQFTLPASDKGIVTLQLDRFSQAEFGQDPRVKRLVVHADTPSDDVISTRDTLIFDVNCVDKLEHALYLWDTAVYYDQTCTFDTQVKNVRFFVNAYWGATTKEYMHLIPLESMFLDPSCHNSVVEPRCGEEVHNTETATLTSYDSNIQHASRLYTYESTYSVQRNDPYESCIDWGDFRRNGEEYHREVDSAINLLVHQVRSAFDRPCIQRAVQQGKKIEIHVIGFTDQNSLHRKCEYIGETIAMLDSSVFVGQQAFDIVVPEKNRTRYENGHIPDGMNFRATPYGGNQLLSDLRGIYTAILLDNVWREELQSLVADSEANQLSYSDLRSNSQLVVSAWGEAISSENNLSRAQKRSVRVVITVPEPDATTPDNPIAVESGKTVILCEGCVE